MQGRKNTGKPKRKWEANTQGRYQCPYCEFESGTPQGIGRHVADMHKGAGMMSADAIQAQNRIAVAAAECADTRTAAGPDMAAAGAGISFYPAMTPETQRVRRVCNAAVSMLTSARYRELPPALKMDVLAVMRMRLMEETGAAEAAMGGEMLGQSLDPLDTPRLPA